MTDAKTFDLISALSGRSFPEETVKIFLNEQLMYTLGKLEKDHDRGEIKTEDYNEARKALMEEFSDEVVKVHIKGVPRYVLKALGDKFDTEYPGKKDPVTKERIRTSDESDIFEEWIWRTYTTRFENSEGGVQEASDEVIRAFRDQAPRAALQAVSYAIDELSLLSSRGFESATDKDTGYEATISSTDFS